MKKRRIWALVLLWAVLALTLGCGKADQGKQEEDRSTKGNMVLSFINIGKGDAFLIQVPDGGYYMCDTGKKEDYPIVERFLEIKQVERLEGIFLSHGHKDHAGGLALILEKYPVGRVYLSGRDDITGKETNPKQTAAEHRTEVVELQGGELLKLGGAEVQVWIPKIKDTEKENNNSMVLRWTLEDTSFLMTGDMEKGEEKEFLQSFGECRADVLKLGHHGEKDATSKDLLKAVKPLYGIITGNEAENPDSMNPKIAKRLKKYKVEAFYSEGEQIAWEFTADGTSVKTEEIMDE